MSCMIEDSAGVTQGGAVIPLRARCLYMHRGGFIVLNISIMISHARKHGHHLTNIHE